MKKITPIVLLTALFLSCGKSVSTCEDCGEFFEYTYTDLITFNTQSVQTSILIEQPYADWELSDQEPDPEIIYSEHSLDESSIFVELMVDAGSGTEGYQTEIVTTESVGDSLFLWYGSVTESVLAKQAKSEIPRSPYFRIVKINIQVPETYSAEAEFKIRY